MYNIGVDYMKTVNDTILKVATSPDKLITTLEAEYILRNCGILNKNNQIKNVYKDIVLKTSKHNND